MKRIDVGRWRAPGIEERYRRILYALRSGGVIEPSLSPFGFVGSRGDMAGLLVPHQHMLRGATVRDVNLSGASFRENWIEDCVFVNVVLDKADLRSIKDHGNRFENCSFVRTDFGSAGLGYRGTAYKGCVFERARFRKTVFARAEFDGCRFCDCLLDRVDFDASSFVDCSFCGKLRDIWFRGGFALPSREAYFGKPRRNEMKNVSFAEASLWQMTFSDHCDLSTIILPKKGNYKLFDNWAARLDHVAREAEQWSGSERTEAMIFAKSYMTHARKQGRFLLNCDEVLNEFGRSLGARIVDTLCSWSPQE